MYPIPIISGIPADRDGFKAMFDEAGIAHLPVPEPSIADTLVQCAECGRDCWIGPKQTITHRRDGVPVNCYFCIIAMMRSGEMDSTAMVNLGDERDKHPRRNSS